MSPQPQGLGLVLQLPVGNAASALKTVALAVATPYIAYRLSPGNFTAKADITALDLNAPEVALRFDEPGHDEVYKAIVNAGLPQLRSIWSTFHPFNLLTVLAKNLGVQCLVRFNAYMLDMLEHEHRVIEADELGQEAPELPPFPDLSPVASEGLWSAVRELQVTTVRRIYEHVAVWRLGPGRAMALLRDARLWIRDVLAIKQRSAPVSRKLTSYAAAWAHATVLFYAADCTVAVGYLTYRVAYKRNTTPGKKTAYWFKAAACQVARCGILLVTVSGGAALGSWVSPGWGSSIGSMATDLLVSLACFNAIKSILGE